MILSTLTRMIQKCDLYHNDIISPHQGVLIIQRSHKASSKKHIYIYTHYDILNNQIAALFASFIKLKR